MDINRALRLAISTGEVNLGQEQALKAIENKQAKLLILANNCPRTILEEVRATKTPAYRYRGNNVELGAACGKPFSISTVTIIEEGNSEIMALRPAKPTSVLEPETPAPIPEVPADTPTTEIAEPDVPTDDIPTDVPLAEE